MGVIGRKKDSVPFEKLHTISYEKVPTVRVGMWALVEARHWME